MRFQYYKKSFCVSERVEKWHICRYWPKTCSRTLILGSVFLNGAKLANLHNNGLDYGIGCSQAKSGIIDRAKTSFCGDGNMGESRIDNRLRSSLYGRTVTFVSCPLCGSWVNEDDDVADASPFTALSANLPQTHSNEHIIHIYIYWNINVGCYLRCSRWRGANSPRNKCTICQIGLGLF